MLCQPTNSTQGGTDKDTSTQGGTEKDWGLGTEVWGLATRATREPGTDKQTDRLTDRQTDRMTDIFCRPSRPPNPELGFTTLGHIMEIRVLRTTFLRVPTNPVPGENSVTDLRLTSDWRYSVVGTNAGK